MTAEADIHLATYGTLGPGKPNHHHLAALRGTWTTGFVRGRLRDEGWGAAQGYPGLVLGDGDEIRVDLLRSDELPEHWPRLDAFEGDGYRRVVTTVVTPDGDVEACIYVLASRQSTPRRRGDWFAAGITANSGLSTLRGNATAAHDNGMRPCRAGERLRFTSPLFPDLLPLRCRRPEEDHEQSSVRRVWLNGAVVCRAT